MMLKQFDENQATMSDYIGKLETLTNKDNLFTRNLNYKNGIQWVLKNPTTVPLQ